MSVTKVLKVDFLLSAPSKLHEENSPNVLQADLKTSSMAKMWLLGCENNVKERRSASDFSPDPEHSTSFKLGKPLKFLTVIPASQKRFKAIT
jgi:hypothetical protein